MSRSFSSTSRALLKWMGFDKTKLPAPFDTAVVKYSQNGWSSEGAIKSIEILHRSDGSSPVHQSKYNPADKSYIVSARITPADGSKARTHHIYKDGKGTFKKGDKREFSSSSTARR